VLGNKFSELKVLNPVNAEKGDVVILGIYESVLLKTALLMYMFPLVMMFAGGIIMLMVEGWIGLALNQGWVIVASFTGLLIAFILISKLSGKFAYNAKYQPVILNKATLTDIKSSPFNVEIKPL
jgi:sigma-E factor negative regulatory protein RseC